MNLDLSGSSKNVEVEMYALNVDTKLGRYTTQNLINCAEELIVDVNDIFFTQVDFPSSDSLQM